MADELVEAIWNGPFDGELPGYGLVRRGERIRVPRAQAQDNSHFQPIPPKNAAKSDAPKRADS